MANTREPTPQLLIDAADGQPSGSYSLQSLRIIIVSALLDTAAITATGTNASTAATLSGQTNVVTTVASGTGVILPAGLRTVVMNRGANPLAVYPPNTGQIEALGTNTPYMLQPGQDCQFIFPAALSPPQGYASLFLNVPNLPTTLPGVVGEVWNDAGFVSIVQP